MSVGPGAAKEAKTPPIPAVLEELELSLQELDSALSQLFGKMEPISETIPSDKEDWAQKELRGSSDIFMQINKIRTDFVEPWTQKVRARTRRLEV